MRLSGGLGGSMGCAALAGARHTRVDVFTHARAAIAQLPRRGRAPAGGDLGIV